MSATEGLFCEDEGFCVCGHDCLRPATYAEAWRRAEADRDWLARQTVECLLLGVDTARSVAVNSQRMECELYMIHRAHFGRVAATTDAEWAFIIGRGYAFTRRSAAEGLVS